MARQIGSIQLNGTIDGISFYGMGKGYYARAKSSLNGKRFRKDKAFERSRASSRRFAAANRLAGLVYRKMDAKHRAYPLFCRLKSMAIGLLHEGRNEGKTMEFMVKWLAQSGYWKPEAGKKSALTVSAT